MDRTHTPGTGGSLEDKSLGELVATATRDLSLLLHQEVELAKAELKQDISAAGKGAGLFGGAGFTAHDPPNSTQQDIVTGGICVEIFNPLMPCTTTSTQTRARMMGARSLHINGVNVAMCDGSGRFVPNTININVWRALSTSQGGEVISEQ